MDEESSAASRYDLGGEASGPVPSEASSGSWDQLSLLGTSYAIFKPQFVIDAASGSMAVSLTVEEFWTGVRLACEVNPSMAFPADMPIALAWLEQRMLALTNLLSPF